MPAPCTAAESSCAANRQQEPVFAARRLLLPSAVMCPTPSSMQANPSAAVTLSAVCAAPFLLQGNTTIDLAHHGK